MRGVVVTHQKLCYAAKEPDLGKRGKKRMDVPMMQKNEKD